MAEHPDAMFPPEELNADFTPRSYQLELFEHAKKQNSILVLGTGSGKTFISILLIKELAHQIRGSLADAKRTVFVVNTVPLVHQQAEAIKRHTALKVGLYEGSMNVDIWSDEKWKEELEKHEVLVMVAQIFLDIILHARLRMSSINLLIMDECHHTSGNHPMREVMRQYESLKCSSPGQCPRILGLTACVIHKKCKPKDVKPAMKKLEAAMDSALVTSIYIDEVIKHSTGPKEVIVLFAPEKKSEYQEMIVAQLLGVEQEIAEKTVIEKKFKKVVKKKLRNIVAILEELGDWSAARAIKFEMEDLEESEEMEDVPAMKEVMKLLCDRLQQIYEYCEKEEVVMTNPLHHVSNKVKRLIDIMRSCKRDVYGLIFVQRRTVTKILYDLLRGVAEANEDLAFINALYVVGSNTRSAVDVNLAKLEQRKQAITISKFRNGECNFIVSTSVLEEGVDIRKCNIVIRFSEPQNYRSYVQSRGRARALPSRYVLLTDHFNKDDLENDIDVYKRIEAILTSLCHDRPLPSQMEVSRHFAEDLYIPPYEPYGCDGPKITMNSAIPLINVYCGQLPQDKFTELAPEVEYENARDVESIGVKLETGVRAGIRLPMNAPMKQMILGDWMENKELAKKSAAIYLCRRLHEMGELNEYLRPRDNKDEAFVDGLVEVPDEPQLLRAAAAGTRKRRQIYDRAVSEAFTHQCEGHFYLYSFTIRPKGSNTSDIHVDSSMYDGSLGILCMKELIHFPFPLYFCKWGEVVVETHFVKKLTIINSEIIRYIEHFHKVVYEQLLHINPSVLEFDSQNSGVFIAPLTKSGAFDISLLKKLKPLTCLTPTVTRPSSEVFRFERSAYENSIIYPIYNPGELYYATDIQQNQTPLTKFPDNTRGYDTYEDYYWLRYNWKITNRTQPLVVAKHMVKELNYLKKAKIKDRRQSREPPQFIPELCGVMPLKASFWWQLMCIPSIMHRLNSFAVAHQLGSDMNFSFSQLEELPALDFNWTEKYVGDPTNDLRENLAVSLMCPRDTYIHPMMLVQALTLRQANDNFDLERLEILGDSFLKYIIGEHVFLKFSQKHEGQLSLLRGQLVCNKTLYSLAKVKGIPEKVLSVNLYPRGNSLLPGFLVKKNVAALLYNMEVPHEVWPELSDFGSADNVRSEVTKKIKLDKGNQVRGSCYNPWTHHELADKSVADVVEALIGAYMLVCGCQAAVTFLHNLGLGVSRGESLLKSTFQVPSALVNQEPWALEELNKLYRKQCLDRMECKIKYIFRDKSFIVQAVTHSSYKQTFTDCYQRLEFLGDAVLDFLVTGLVFTRHAQYTPGQVSDLRSYYVNNETLAKVCVKAKLHKHLLHMAPKLQATIDKFLNSLDSGIEEDVSSEDEDTEDVNTEDDVANWEDVDVPKALGDMVEAIIGAVYLDSGRSLQKAWDVIQHLMGDLIRYSMKDIPINCIRQLYEKMPDKVKFDAVKREDEDTMATCIVTIKDHFQVTGHGKNKRTAKMAAARKALAKLRETENN